MQDEDIRLESTDVVKTKINMDSSPPPVQSFLSSTPDVPDKVDKFTTPAQPEPFLTVPQPPPVQRHRGRPDTIDIPQAVNVGGTDFNTNFTPPPIHFPSQKPTTNAVSPNAQSPYHSPYNVAAAGIKDFVKQIIAIITGPPGGLPLLH